MEISNALVFCMISVHLAIRLRSGGSDMAMREKLAIFMSIAAMMATISPPAIAAAEPQIFTPASPWAIDFASKSCVLSRSFSKGAESMSLRFELVAPETFGTLTVIGKPFGGISYSSNFQIRVGANQPALLQNGWLLIRAPAADGKPVPGVLVRYINLSNQGPHSDAADAPAATAKVAFQWDQQTLEVQLGRMDTVLGTLKKCTDNLMQSWGYDPAVQNTLSRKPAINGNPSNWIYFPETTKNTSNQTKLQVRVDLDEAGEPTGCEPLDADEVPDLAKSACAQLLKKAHFHPALDKAGNPVRSYTVASSVLPWPTR